MLSNAQVPPSVTVHRASVQNSPSLTSSRFGHYLVRPILRLGPLAFSLTVLGVLVAAWVQRDEGHLTAESGAGYWLGICGAIIMLMLVAYPLRKRAKALHRVGRVANWFRLHMILGIIGPALVILHTNFKLGSLNSRLALLTMLVVVASGIAGRYLYSKVHKGLYGSQAVLRDVLADVMALKSGLGISLAGNTAISHELERYTPNRKAGTRTLAASIATVTLAGARTRTSRRLILREVSSQLKSAKGRQRITRRQSKSQMREIDSHLKIYFAAVKKAERLQFYERVFGLWHHLHLPLFVLLALTVTLHIIAVHLY